MAVNSYPWPNPIVPPTQSPSNEIRWIQGENAAKAYPVAPGSTVILMDSEDSYFYIKSVAFNGIPNPLRKFKYEEIFEIVPELPVAVDKTEYVSKEDFNKAIEELKALIKPNKNRGDRYAKSDIRRDE